MLLIPFEDQIMQILNQASRYFDSHLSTLPHPLQALPKTSDKFHPVPTENVRQPRSWSDPRSQGTGPSIHPKPVLLALSNGKCHLVISCHMTRLTCSSHKSHHPLCCATIIFYNITIFILPFKVGSLKSIKRPSLAPCRGTASRRLDLGGCPGWTLRCSLSQGSGKCRDKCPECMWIWMPSKDMER